MKRYQNLKFVGARYMTFQELLKDEREAGRVEGRAEGRAARGEAITALQSARARRLRECAIFFTAIDILLL